MESTFDTECHGPVAPERPTFWNLYLEGGRMLKHAALGSTVASLPLLLGNIFLVDLGLCLLVLYVLDVRESAIIAYHRMRVVRRWLREPEPVRSEILRAERFRYEALVREPLHARLPFLRRPQCGFLKLDGGLLVGIHNEEANVIAFTDAEGLIRARRLAMRLGIWDNWVVVDARPPRAAR